MNAAERKLQRFVLAAFQAHVEQTMEDTGQLPFALHAVGHYDGRVVIEAALDTGQAAIATLASIPIAVDPQEATA